MFRIAVVLAALISTAAGQTNVNGILDALSKTHKVEELSASRDGRRAAWVQDGLFWWDFAGGSPRRISACAGKCAEGGAAWAVDGGRLAFLSDAEDKGQQQLYVAAPTGKKSGKPKRLTQLKGQLADARWSPDGRTIAVLFTEDAPHSLGPVEAIVPELGAIDAKIFVQRIALVDAATGAVRQISPAGMYVYEFDWSPDSKGLVFTGAPPPGDDNWYVARIYTIDVATENLESVLEPHMQVANPRWSPDGKTIAFIGGLMSDEGVTGGDIFTIPANGGELKNITPDSKSSPGWFSWLPSSDGFIVLDHARGSTMVETLDLGGAKKVLWSGKESIVFSGNAETSAVVRTSWSRAPEIWAGPTGRWEQITHVNAEQKPLWGDAKSIEWKSDQFDVQGWLVFPVGFTPGRRYPMVVVPHGGPSAEKRPSWPGPFFDLTVLSSQGYFVFYPNPRGSYGQGEAFTRANVKDFGYGDLRDVLMGVDRVLHDYPVDERRVGIAGWSYGGYMTMWALTQTHRFRAAVAGAGVSDWLSYYGENSIDQWLIPFFGASVYDDPAVYARSSPLTFIKNVKTPTLILVGELDGEVPSPQSREYWHALKTFDVKTQFVIYAGEGHAFHDKEHIRDVMRRTVEWFEAEMK
jgi:dipeptidyl aminopeptidase/acylaminoacyl peptidase